MGRYTRTVGMKVRETMVGVARMIIGQMTELGDDAWRKIVHVVFEG
jgi:hypothetical protein